MSEEIISGICPGCDRPICPQEVSVEYDGEIMHIDCAVHEMDAVGFDDFFGCNG